MPDQLRVEQHIGKENQNLIGTLCTSLTGLVDYRYSLRRIFRMSESIIIVQSSNSD